MTEAVIVATARSPIGRAVKGSLVDVRPDDITAQIIRAALDKVPACSTPAMIDDLFLGCGLPGGEQGFNLARVVAVQLGYDALRRHHHPVLLLVAADHPHGVHAIKAGEGDVFISAGVETVSRFVKGTSDSWPDTHNPIFADAEARTAQAAGGGKLARPARGRPAPGHLHPDGPDRREPGPVKHVSREDMDHFGVRSQNLAEKAINDGFWAREITPVTLPDGTRGLDRRRAARGRHLRGRLATQAGVPPGRAGHRGQLLPAQRRRGRPGDHERHESRRTRA